MSASVTTKIAARVRLFRALVSVWFHPKEELTRLEAEIEAKRNEKIEVSRPVDLPETEV